MSARLLYNDDGETLDEIVFDGSVHVEQMSDDLYWMRVGESHFHFRAEPYITEDDEGDEVVKVRIRLTLDDEDVNDFPLVQRHKTEAEFDADQRFLVAANAADKDTRKVDGDWYVTVRKEAVPA